MTATVPNDLVVLSMVSDDLLMINSKNSCQSPNHQVCVQLLMAAWLSAAEISQVQMSSNQSSEWLKIAATPPLHRMCLSMNSKKIIKFMLANEKMS